MSFTNPSSAAIAVKEFKSTRVKVCSSDAFVILKDTKSYTKYTACVLNHILIDSDLSDLAKLAFILIDSEAIKDYNYTGNRSALYTMRNLSAELNCTKSTIYTIRNELINKGYLSIKNKNELIPTIPDKVFAKLVTDKNIYKKTLPYIEGDNKLIYLDNSKLFIKINQQLLQEIVANKNLNTFEKILWIQFFKNSYCSHQQGRDGIFSTTRLKLAKIFQKSNSKICNSLNRLKDCGFLVGKIHKTISDREESRGKAVNMLKLAVSLPEYNMSQLLENQPNRRKAITKIGQAITKIEPPIIKIGQNQPDTIINKNNILKNLSKAVAPVDNLKSGSNHSPAAKVIENNIFENGIAKTAVSHNPNGIAGKLQNVARLIQARMQLEKENQAKSDNQENKTTTEAHRVQEQPSKPRSAFLDLPETLKPYIRKLATMPCMSVKAELQEVLQRVAIKNLTLEQIDMAERYAYKLHTSKLAKGRAAQLSLIEMKGQLLYHSANWQLRANTKDKVKTCLQFAWGAISDGSWQTPKGFEMHKILSRELENHIQKKKDYGVAGQEYANFREELNKRLGVALTTFLYNRWED